MNSLLFPVALFPDESLRSYIVRLALENHVPAQWFLSDPARARREARLDTLTVEELQQFTVPLSVTTETLAAHSSHALAPQILGQPELTPQDERTWLTGQFERCCPECLEDAPFLRRLWRLRNVTACLRHEHLLVDRCADGHSIRLYPAPSVSFTCGQRVAPSAAGLRSLDAQRHLQAMLSGEPAPATTGLLPSLTGPQYLAALALITGIFRLIEGRGHERSEDPPCAIVHERQEAAHGVLADWPGRFLDILDKYRRGGLTLHENFRPLPQRFARLAATGITSFQDAYFLYVGTRWNGRVDRRVVGLDPTILPEKRLLTKTEAGKLLGAAWPTINALWDSGSLPLTTLVDGTRVISRSDLLAAVKNREQRMTRNEVAAFLQLDRASVDRLVVDGHLVRHQAIGVPAGYFDPAEVRHFRDDLMARGTRHPQEDWLTITRAVQSLSKHGLTVADVIDRLLSGDLVAGTVAEGVGLKKLRFAPFDIARINADARKRLIQERGLTISDAARRLHAKPVTIRRMIGGGRLGLNDFGRIAEADIVPIEMARTPEAR